MIHPEPGQVGVLICDLFVTNIRDKGIASERIRSGIELEVKRYIADAEVMSTYGEAETRYHSPWVLVQHNDQNIGVPQRVLMRITPDENVINETATQNNYAMRWTDGGGWVPVEKMEVEATDELVREYCGDYRI